MTSGSCRASGPSLRSTAMLPIQSRKYSDGMYIKWESSYCCSTRFLSVLFCFLDNSFFSFRLFKSYTQWESTQIFYNSRLTTIQFSTGFNNRSPQHPHVLRFYRLRTALRVSVSRHSEFIMFNVPSQFSSFAEPAATFWLGFAFEPQQGKNQGRRTASSSMGGREGSEYCIINSLRSAFIFASNIENFIMSPAGACIKACFCVSFSSASPCSTWLDSKNFYVFSSRILFFTRKPKTHTHTMAIQPAEKPVLEREEE